MPASRPNLVIINKQKKRKRIFYLVDYAVPTDYKTKINETEKSDKYLDLARERKKL